GEGGITVGSLFAMISYVLMLNGPAMRMGFFINMAATASASANRIFTILDMESTIVEKPDAQDMSQVSGKITFRDVSFTYDSPIDYTMDDAQSPKDVEDSGERPTQSMSFTTEGPVVLKDIDFEALPGETIALVGPTGSGKTTIINLLSRFYDATEGQILIDNIDVRDVRLDTMRHQIGMVLQNPFLFSATIAENIAYGHPDRVADQEAIERVAKAANAHKFIMEFPDGYNTMVGERGVTLSGGQKQRVAIARALLGDPQILVLDDATSSVDTETEHQIQQALNLLMEKRTTFIIAQRLLSLKNADQILVLDQGRIVARGTHDELLMQDGLYRHIYDLQLRDQETVTRLQYDGVAV
ncbi:MAG: ABC transporter ATP-binding protein, partial [Chloroflexota bacterium]